MTTKTTGETVELRAGHLDDQQLARAEAIDRARAALISRSGGFAPGTTGPDAIDLVNVAGWIIDGRDPWAEYADSAATFRHVVRAATDEAVDQLADATGVDPDAPLPDNTDCTCMWCTETPADHDDEDDDQIGSVRG
jgi:hypothetical protein